MRRREREGAERREAGEGKLWSYGKCNIRGHRCQSAATGPRIFQASFQIAPYGLDHLLVVIQKIGDALQQRLQRNALLQDLGTFQSSTFFEALSRSRFKALT